MKESRMGWICSSRGGKRRGWRTSSYAVSMARTVEGGKSGIFIEAMEKGGLRNNTMRGGRRGEVGG